MFLTLLTNASFRKSVCIMLDKTSKALVVGAKITAGLALSYIVYKSYKRLTKKSKKTVGQLDQLWIYPIKACGGISISEAECTVAGLKYKHLMDRQFILMTVEEGKRVSLKELPRAALVKPSYDEMNHCLLLTADGYKTYKLPLDPPEYDETKVKDIKWGKEKTPKGLDCGDEVAEWFSNVMQKDVRLMYYHEEIEPMVPKKEHLRNRLVRPRDTFITYNNSHPYLMICDWSVKDLSRRMGETVDPIRFRPNMIVTGSVAPYCEEKWLDVGIGEAELFSERCCTRCPVINVDPDTAMKREEPLKTLKRLGTGPDSAKAVFGVNLVLEADNTQRIHVGDCISVITA